MSEKFGVRKATAVASAVVVGGLAIYAAIAYGLEPALWRHHEHQAGLAALPAVTRTSLGIPGDAINVGLEGSEADVLCALDAAGWTPADPVTLGSSLKIVGSVLFRRRYVHAPVSDLYFEGRRQDLAFQKPSGFSAAKRHHMRLWKALETGEQGEPVWLGAATYDESVGLSHYTGQITHHVAPDIDAERDGLIADLSAAHKLAATYFVSGVGPTLFARNGGGDPYFTDGEIALARLVAGCKTRGGAPVALPAPAGVAAKNTVFSWFARVWRALP